MTVIATTMISLLLKYLHPIPIGITIMGIPIITITITITITASSTKTTGLIKRVRTKIGKINWLEAIKIVLGTLSTRSTTTRQKWSRKQISSGSILQNYKRYQSRHPKEKLSFHWNPIPWSAHCP